MFCKIDNFEILKNLNIKQGKIDMILDTDTYNEVDDQFALVYALKSNERLNVKAVYAAPFFNHRSTSAKDGMEKSYNEIIRLLDKMDIATDNFVFKGSDRYIENIKSPVESPAVYDLINKAMERNADNPLYVAAIGAITNIASAILINPEIIKKIVVVWLGGQPHYWNTAHEFNLQQDIVASRVIFDSGVPLIQIPCASVASHLLATVPELEYNLKGKNRICDALFELFKQFGNECFKWYEEIKFTWAKEIWDIAAIGYLINPDWLPSSIVHSPILTDNCTYSFDNSRHFIKVVNWVNRNEIFRDMFEKITK